MGGVALLCATSAALYFGSVTRQEEIQRSGYSLNVKARAAARLLAANVRSRELELDLIRQFPILTQGSLDSKALRDFLELRSMFHNEYAWLGVADLNGKVRQATAGVLVGNNVATRPWFTAAMQGALHLGDVHEAVLLANQLPSRSGSEPIRFIDIAAPLMGLDGKIRGVIGAHAQWGWITQEIESTVVKQMGAYNAELLIANQKGQVLYPMDPSGQRVIPSALKESVPFMEVQWSEGGRYLSTMVQIAPSKSSELVWKVVVRQPIQNSTWLNSEVILPLMAMVGGVVALFSGLAFFLSADLQRALRRLQIEIEKPSDLGLLGEAEPTQYKVAEVKALNAALQSLKERHNARVAELMSENTALVAQLHAQLDSGKIIQDDHPLALQTDADSGLLPPDIFNVRLRTAFSVLLRKWTPFTILMVQVDDPYFVSRKFGPAEGATEIKKMAATIYECCGRRSYLTRYRSDVFAVLLLEIESKQQIEALAERVKETVESQFRTFVRVGYATSAAKDAHAQTVMARAVAALGVSSRSVLSYDESNA